MTIFARFCFILFIFFSALSLYGQKKEANVFLHGSVRNFNGEIQLYDLSELNKLKLTPEVSFIPDGENRIATSLKIEKPNYYKVGRNVLYLSPGDDFQVFLNYNDPDSATFRGIHSTENIYLKTTPFPKAGSFLEAGVAIKPSLSQTIDEIYRRAKKREDDLKSLKNISRDFKFLETARIQFDIINSLIKINLYYPIVHKLNEDSTIIFRKECQRVIAPIIKEYEALFFDPAYLKLEVYRDLLNYFLFEYGDKSKLNDTINDWLNAKELVHKIQSSDDRKSMTDFNMRLSEVKVEEYHKTVLDTYNKLVTFNGDAAFDFVMADENNNLVSLTSFKGKVIYIDLWATWCGPCIEERPYLDSLKIRYANNSNVVFISLSIDSDKSNWKKFISKNAIMGSEYIIDRAKLDAYYIVEIPRTIIIDKNFNIAAMRGPKPSSKEVDLLIDDILGNK